MDNPNHVHQWCTNWALMTGEDPYSNGLFCRCGKVLSISDVEEVMNERESASALERAVIEAAKEVCYLNSWTVDGGAYYKLLKTVEALLAPEKE